MEEASSAMEVDAEQIEPNSATSPQPTDSPKPTPRPTPRKLPKFPIDLHMPVTVYWPESNDKIIRALREYEYGGPLPEKTETNSATNSSSNNTVRSDSGESKKEIPLPGVTIRPDYLEETPEDFAIPSNKYIQYAPPSWYGTDIHFDRRRVEYSLDDEDLNWLSEQRLPETDLDEEAMEILLDVLEKESFRQLEFRQINAQVEPAEAVEEKQGDDDDPCSVCGGKDWDDENLIIFCEGCNMPIHQACQDLAVIPEEDWFCDTCVFRAGGPDMFKAPPKSSTSSKRGTGSSQGSASFAPKPTHPVINFEIPLPCVICGMVDGGPMKNTHIPGRFAHLVCALMHPDVWFENDQANVSRVLSSRNKNTPCSICGIPGGLIKCSQRGCNVQYHVMCARENGHQLMFNVPDPEEEEELERAELQEALNAEAQLLASTANPAKAERSRAAPHHCSHGGGEDMDVDIDEFSDDTNPLNSLNTSTTSAVSEKDKEVKKKRKKKTVKKKTPHQPYQSLCALHSGAIRAEKLEAARMASLVIPVDVGRFLKEEDIQHPSEVVAGDTTTFSKAVDIIKKCHTTSSGFTLKKDTFDRLVSYWRAKRLARRLGHMPFIFQLHVLVTHFKEDFDAGRKLESEPRQVEKLIAQYTPQKKFEILKQLRDSVEILRTTLDLVKKREVKKRLALAERVKLFDEVMKAENKPATIRAIFSASSRKSGASSHPFMMGGPKALTIKLPVATVRRVLAQSTSTTSTSNAGRLGPAMTSVTTSSRSANASNYVAYSPPPKKKTSPLPAKDEKKPTSTPTSPIAFQRAALHTVSPQAVLVSNSAKNQVLSPAPTVAGALANDSSSSSSIIVPKTIVAPPISSLPKRTASPPVSVIKMAAAPRSSPSPKPMINSLVGSVPPLSRPMPSPPTSPSSPKHGLAAPSPSKITAYYRPSITASPPFVVAKASSTFSSSPLTTLPMHGAHSAPANPPSTPPKISASAVSPSYFAGRNTGFGPGAPGSPLATASAPDSTPHSDGFSGSEVSSKMDVSMVSEHAPSISTLSSPMATPTKLSHVKMSSLPPVPLATSSPKPMTPLSSPMPRPMPIMLDSDHFDAYSSGMEEENILFNSDVARSSIFDPPKRIVPNGVNAHVHD